MKQKYSLLLPALFILFLCLHTNAQSIIEMNAASPVSNDPSIRTTYGGGIGFGFYSNPLILIKNNQHNYKNRKAAAPFCARLGGDFFIAGMGSRNFKDVPLLAPESGNAKVSFSNMLSGFNADLKFSSRCFNGKVIPYVDAYVGTRSLTCSMNIYPSDRNLKSTDTILSRISGINVGATAGVLINFIDDGYIDFGVSLNHSEVPGKYIDLHSINRSGNTINCYSQSGPTDFLVFKVGLVAYIDPNQGGSANGNGYHTHSGGHWGGHCGGGGHSHVSIHVH